MQAAVVSEERELREDFRLHHLNGLRKSEER